MNMVTVQPAYLVVAYQPNQEQTNAQANRLRQQVIDVFPT